MQAKCRDYLAKLKDPRRIFHATPRFRSERILLLQYPGLYFYWVLFFLSRRFTPRILFQAWWGIGNLMGVLAIIQATVTAELLSARQQRRTGLAGRIRR